LEHTFRLGFRATNNEAKYEALLAGLRTVLGMGAREVEVNSDLRLVVSQVQGSFEAWDSRMKEYLQVVKQVMGKFRTTKLTQMAREQNRHADSLATLASTMTDDVSRLIKVELIMEPNVNTVTDFGVTRVGVTVISTFGPCWIDPIIDFLAENRVSDDKKEANRVCRIASRYWLSADRKLYRKSFGGLYLLCLHPGRVNEFLAELHDGVCGSRVGGMLISSPGNDSGILVATDAKRCC